MSPLQPGAPCWRDEAASDRLGLLDRHPSPALLLHPMHAGWTRTTLADPAVSAALKPQPVPNSPGVLDQRQAWKQPALLQAQS